MRLITESRIHAINRALSSVRSQAQRGPALSRTPSCRQTATGVVRTPEGTQASVVISPPPVDPQVPLSGELIFSKKMYLRSNFGKSIQDTTR